MRAAESHSGFSEREQEPLCGVYMSVRECKLDRTTLLLHDHSTRKITTATVLHYDKVLY